MGFLKLETGLAAMSKDDLADSLAYNSIKVQKLLTLKLEMKYFIVMHGGNTSVFGSSGAGGMLAKMTAFMAVVFVVTSLSYTYAVSYTHLRCSPCLRCSPGSPRVR